MTTPKEALADLQQCAALIGAGQPIPPTLRGWLCRAMRTKITNPSKPLDSLLGLRSRRGGRLHAASRLPQRDAGLCQLADTLPGDQKTRAAELLRRLKAGDADMLELEKRTCRIPRSTRQLVRIIGRQTVASMSLV